jgi:sugar/nucleoside kinase (ribokinase family)
MVAEDTDECGGEAGDRARDAVSEEPLAGPAIGAAVGASLVGADVTLLTAVPSDIGGADHRLLSRLDRTRSLVKTSQLPALRWAAPQVLGDLRSWRMHGDPRLWRVPDLPPGALDGCLVVLANADPDWYADVLSAHRPRFVAVDVDGAWTLYRTKSINLCLRRAHLVTISENDLKALPRGVLSGVRAGYSAGTALVIKRGAAGVRLVVNGEHRDLPPPVSPSSVRTDIGAGDVLLGGLATSLGFDDDMSMDRVEDAYQRCVPIITHLLLSDSFPAFVARVLYDGDARR